MLDDVRAEFSGNLERPIARKGVDDEHFVGPGEAAQAFGQIQFLIQRGYHD